MRLKPSKRTCPDGHVYVKSSNCPTCPVCEAARKPVASFMTGLSAPARRALEREGITSLAELASRNEHDLLQLHGLGPSSLPKIRQALKEAGMEWRT